jgi:ABC-type glycerol-3-phosphate transport system substrate-binding protein
MIASRSFFSFKEHQKQAGFTTKTLLMAAGIGFVIVALVGVGALTLQRGLPKASGQPVTLNYWGLWESKDLIQPLLDQYHKLHPSITVQYQERPIDNYYATLQSRLKGSSEDSPDIVRLHDSWVSGLRKGLSTLPSNVMNASQYESTFYSVNRDQLYSSGNYYAIPLEVDGLALVYNQDLFNAAGITAPPATWDEVRQDASKITQRDQQGN